LNGPGDKPGNQPVNYLRKAMAWAGIFLFIVLCVHSLFNSLAAVIAVEPEYFRASFAEEHTPKYISQITQAIGKLEMSQNLSPGNTRYLENTATIKLIEAGQSSSASALMDAYQSYIDILNSRPIWPYTWINFLRTRAQLGLFDNSFDKALSKTFTLVSVNDELYLKLLHLGLEYWFDISADARNTITQSIEKSDASRSAIIGKMLKELRLGDFVCASLTAQAYERVCA